MIDRTPTRGNCNRFDLMIAIGFAEAKGENTEVLTEAAIVALIIAGSIAVYKAMGIPCACPEDTMWNGRRCGGNSAWSRPGGYKPLCYVTDVTASMISAYRATKAIPALR